ncbi:MAG: IS110 family transposase [Candidatus Doudnabacteria bacterium]|nr:IS110 family transposase [Candidatus Doudnabacteria bacterium]
MSSTNTYIGVDLHKKTCYMTVMDQAGIVSRQIEIKNDREEIDKFFKIYDKDSKVAVESTMNWIPFYEQVEKMGFKVVLSNPLMTKAVAAARIKNDKVDSKILAELMRTDFLPTAYIQPKEIRDLKELIRQRAVYVQMQTKIKNKIHSVLFKTGDKVPVKNLFGKGGRKFLAELKASPVYRAELDRYLLTLDGFGLQIKGMEKDIALKAKADYDCKLLCTIPGVGPYTALMIKSEIGDIGRFGSSEKLCNYAGIVPSTYASGEKIRTGRITKRGSKWLRKALVDAVTSSCRNTNKISVFYKKLKKSKGTGKAKVAAARKLCSIIFAMLTDKQPFKEFVPVKER